MADRATVWDGPTIEAKWLRSYSIATGYPAEDGQPKIDAAVARDLLLPIMRNVLVIGDTSSLDNRTDADLNAIGEAEGIRRPPAVGSSGYVVISTATGGATIFAGDTLKPRNSNVIYQCAATALYGNAKQVLITAVSVGPGTNLPSNTEMEWSNPRPGCSPSCVVWSEGLTGGRDQADNDEYKTVIIDRRGHQATAGNEHAYAALLGDPFATGIAVQRAFVWPAISGTGTIGFSFTMRPEAPGGTRLPSTAQLAIMLAALEAAFPGDDGAVQISLSEEPASVSFKATWAKSAAGWATPRAWPAYIPTTQWYVDGGAAITAESMRVTSDTGGTPVGPLAGDVLALFNVAAIVDGATRPAFERKTIATVTPAGGNSYDLTFDMAAGASSTFEPASGALVSPWSDSLNLVTAGVADYFDHMGPGEMYSEPLPDPGRRGRRQPESRESWPSVITNRLDAIVQEVSAVSSATLVVPSGPQATQVGDLGVLVYLRRLTDMAFYAE